MEVREAANKTVLLIEYVTSTVHLPPWDAIMINWMVLDNTGIGLEILITEASCSMIASWVEDTPSIYVQFTHANQRLVMNPKKTSSQLSQFFNLEGCAGLHVHQDLQKIINKIRCSWRHLFDHY